MTLVHQDDRVNRIFSSGASHVLSSHIRVIANKREAGEVAISLYTAHSAPREPVQRRPQGRHAPTGAHERRYTPMFQSTFIPVGDSLSARTASAGLGRATSCAPLRAGLRAGVLALAVSLGGLTVSSTVSAAEPRRPECVAPAKPGGGFDLTCRLTQTSLKNDGF